MEIREARTFIAVVEESGLSAAARRLHLSQSALSQTIQSLERRLGVRLLVRTSTGTRPTEAGELLLYEARGLVERHDQALAALAAVTGASASAGGAIRLGVPLEFPPSLLPGVLAQIGSTHPETRVELRHSSSAAQLAALQAHELDIALVRDRPATPLFDTVLAVEEAMGVILAAALADELAEPAGVRLHRLAGLDWIGFPRSETPAWYDQVTATLRSHGITVRPSSDRDDHPVIAEVKLAAVATGRTFALASPEWSRSLPGGMRWHPLIGAPIVRRTWAVWHAASRRRDLATLVAALDLTAR